MTLLSAANKILTTLIQECLVKYSKNKIGDYQCGFVKRRSPVNAIDLMKQIMEKAYE